VVRVVDHGKAFVAWAYFNPASKLRARVLDWNEDASIDDEWWSKRVREAFERRRGLPGMEDTDVYRAIYAEGDGIPGLIVDRYGEYLVLQSLTAGVERVKDGIRDALIDAAAPAGIFERSDAEARMLEGLAPAAGAIAGAAPPKRIEVREKGRRFLVDVAGGQKTGFYIDQRDNRSRVAEYARGREVLDLFAYTGGFSVCALLAGASRATLVESSYPALETAEANLAANGIAEDAAELIHGNVFEVARSFRDSGRLFDLVVADPPKFAQSRAQLSGAERAYKDINLLAMKLLAPGGILATFSCSGAVEIEHFSRIVAWAAADADRRVQVLGRLSQGPDHPVVPAFPESEYLKGLVCRVL
jgi:23S rRNA (cytosine1962-C5)-methyltransferase